MGKTAATMFAKEGARIAVFEKKNKDAGELTAQEITRQGGEARFYEVDISNEQQVQEAVACVVTDFEKIDVLYNNAGVMPAADHSVVDTSEEVWDLVMNINVKGIFFMTKYVIPEMENTSQDLLLTLHRLWQKWAVPYHKMRILRLKVLL